MSYKSIACHVRLRPPTATDGKLDPEAIIIKNNKVSASSARGDKRYHFEFDGCHDASSTQEQVFDAVAPLLQQAYHGKNTTIFAYGVTGAGKTHTMQGTLADPGIIPRAIDHVFQEQSKNEPNMGISFSYVEILLDEVYDLLGDRSMPRKCEIRMNAEGHNVVPDVIVQPITSPTEFAIIYEAAAKTRKTAATSLNSSSSRSHAILTLFVNTDNTGGPSNGTCGKVCLVDLAGSENNNLTGNDKERMRESSAINTSLTTLGKVVDALNVSSKRRQSDTGGGAFVPYRESKLTRLLQDALGGTSQNLLICCLAPGGKFARDTIHTLQFGRKSKSVENRLKVAEQSRRTSLTAQPSHASAINPLASFKVHASTAGQGRAVPRGLLARPITGALTSNVNVQKVKTVAAAKGDEKTVKKVKESYGMELSETELEIRIQKIVQQYAAQQQQQPNSLTEETTVTAAAARPETSQPPLAIPPRSHMSQVSGEDHANHPAAGLKSMSEGEKENRARVLVNHARKLQQRGDLIQALEIYQKAYEYVPTNNRLALRISEIELAHEGVIPQEKGGATPLLKRPRDTGSLALDGPSSGEGDRSVKRRIETTN